MEVFEACFSPNDILKAKWIAMKLYQVLEPFEVGRIGEGQLHHYTELRWINLSLEREEIRQYTHFSYVNEVSSSKRTLDCLLNHCQQMVVFHLFPSSRSKFSLQRYLYIRFE